MPRLRQRRLENPLKHQPWIPLGARVILQRHAIQGEKLHSQSLRLHVKSQWLSAGIVSTSVPTIFSHAESQPQNNFTSLALQATPQVLTQENLAAVLASVVAPAGTVTQPLLVPISMAGQQGLAMWTFPTATVAALPGLTATPSTAGVFKLSLANLQAPMLSTALQTSAPAAPTLPAQPVFQAPQVMQPQTPLQTQPVPMIAPTLKAAETQAQITVQPTSFSFNPAIISAASLGGQTQLLSSLAATPVITSAIPGVQSIANQILTNAQGQVIGTLPWLLNSAGITASSMPVALSAQNLQVQTVTPQLLLNAQGQVIATLASTAMQPAVVQKQSDPQSPEKLDEQMPPIEPAPAISQPAVVLASPTPVPASPPSPVPLPCSETPTVGQLVSKSQATAIDEDGINLEEIREFAKNFKIRRLSLGLTQTQVGQALTATEGPAYSQSAICRFEKLDITPKSAQKLKPVLEKWLLEAEMRNQEGQQNLMDFVGGEPSKKRKRRTSFTPQAIEALNAYFEKNALPTGQEITEIAKELNYDREVVRVWFCNRRQTLKNTSKLNVFQIP
uniref:POU domain protein n=1 Tax=Geotrypetes seraphini TaxID=260995 RepID=A0A6P8R6A1_GEOSA|nr:POU domain, class 6, transcription factor 1 isoform X2 [Geotrypetes seraphini]